MVDLGAEEDGGRVDSFETRTEKSFAQKIAFKSDDDDGDATVHFILEEAFGFLIPTLFVSLFLSFFLLS